MNHQWQQVEVLNFSGQIEVLQSWITITAWRYVGTDLFLGPEPARIAEELKLPFAIGSVISTEGQFGNPWGGRFPAHKSHYSMRSTG